MSKKVEIVEMLIDSGKFRKGQRWPLENAPTIVKLWAELPGVLGSKLICKVFDEPYTSPIEKTKEEPYTCARCGYVEGTPLSDAIESDKNEDRQDLQDKNQAEIDKLFPKDPEETPEDQETYCKGKKGDGSPCKFKGTHVLANGYCGIHKNQAPNNQGS